ncbi:MAG: AmmeMemoRadiSam system protein A [Sulfuricaulis sp.]|uniref:AmmeMemoRadiSam system protein A n=1 Tax=Sulfuricaulis sp. TaxID=2003553 RepID=UPI0025D085A5|nr:AmmeMemoRadiSam system protein A [Sulfuricaulis sp.]MCR4348174.1 AmmeMemoRadiSam system protein A [Sulfuricaulis sp.]
MVLTSSNNPAAALTPPLTQQLLESARESIRKGLCGESLAVKATDYPEALRQKRATFVTLHVEGKLHGCVGTLEARKPLVEDVVSNAWSAAFHDSRFPALTWPEFEQLEIHISILSPPEPMTFSSEADLLAQLRPHVDGLIIEDGHHRGTFLPSVWEQLPSPRDFLRQLKLKAGLNQDYWSKNIHVHRYTAESVP